MLHIIRGLPGSGKSTFARTLGIFHVEVDMFFMEDGEHKFNPKLLPRAHKWCQYQVKKALLKPMDVVVSNTFTRLWEMQHYIDLATECNTSFRVYWARGKFHNVHNIPDYAINRMRDRWEPYDGEMEV